MEGVVSPMSPLFLFGNQKCLYPENESLSAFVVGLGHKRNALVAIE